MVFGRAISKGTILWGILTLVAVFFSMASLQSEGLIRYVYFIVAIIACYGIRLATRRERNDNASR